MSYRVAKLSFLALLLTAGCVHPDKAPRFTPAWEPFDAAGHGWEHTRKALLVADCQIHNLLSKALPERNLSTETAIDSAIRPPQLDLFSADVLSWIIHEGSPEAELVLQLGDALDLACDGEFNTFVEVMEAGGKPWFMAPGNHDFFYFGTYDPDDVELWDEACHRSGTPLRKDRFIGLYVAALLRQDDPGFAALADALGLSDQRDLPAEELTAKLPKYFDWRRDPESPGLLARVSWRIDLQRPWRSYIIQAVDLTRPGMDGLRTTAVLLDSCQYNRRPLLIPNAWASYPVGLNCGFTGEMLPDQLRTVRAWADDPLPGETFVFMCHHPFESLAPRTRSSLGWLWRERSVSMLVTAHTHAGYYAHHDLGGAQDELELNLGSTTDWPMEWRTFQGFVHPTEQRIYVKAERQTLVDALGHREGYFQLDWEVPVDAPDDYRKYKQGDAASSLLVDFYLYHHLVPYWLPQPSVRANAAARRTEEQVKDTLLWTYWRLIKSFPTDRRQPPRWPADCASDDEVSARIMELTRTNNSIETKIALLEELQLFERTRRTRDPDNGESLDGERARFKISQAAWASRFESSAGRRLRLEDDLIRVDWKPALRKVAAPPR